MPKRNRIVYICLLVCLALPLIKAEGQTYSYIYIQADKGVKFNVKANDEMLPQYGSSYAIVPKLKAGTNKIYILFPNHEYAPQRYIVEVPENGFRNFLLTYYQDGICLYDVDSKTYLHGETMTEQQVTGNTASAESMNISPPKDPTGILTDIDDSSLVIKKPLKQYTPPAKENGTYNSSAPETTKYDSIVRDSYGRPIDTIVIERPVVKNEVVPKSPEESYDDSTAFYEAAKPAPTVPANQTIVQESKQTAEPLDDSAAFYKAKKTKALAQANHTIVKEPKQAQAKPADEGKISLPHYPAKTLDAPANLSPAAASAVAQDNKAPATIKSKCGAAIGEKAYDDIYVKSLQKSDHERLKFLLSNIKNCFSCNQIRVLATTLATDPERYALFKQAYPQHITDRENFPSLESTLSKREWKDYFELLLQ